VSERGWLTPNPGAEEVLCRTLIIPLDDQLQILAAVNGALAELAKAYNWQQFGAMTPEDTAELMFAFYEDYASSDCVFPCICEVPLDPSFGVEITVRIIRRNSAGFTEMLVDGEWVTPTGDYEVPEPDVRTEPTSAERKCLAAANAVFVLEQIYEEVTDAWSTFHTTGAVFSALFDVGIALLGAFAGPTAAGHAAFGKTIFDTFIETLDAIAADVWTSTFTSEFICLLYEHATDTAGVITFDWAAIRQAVFNLFVESGAIIDTDRALLWGQVGYLLEIVAAGGLNVAGGTTGVDEYDCAICEEWCAYFDFGASAHEFLVLAAGYGTYIPSPAAGAGWNGNFINASSQEALYIGRTFPETVVNRIKVFYDKTAGGGANNVARFQLWNNGGLVYNGNTSNPIGLNVTVEYFPSDVTCDEIRFDVNTGSSAGTITIEQLILAGPGENVFGIDNCP